VVLQVFGKKMCEFQPLIVGIGGTTRADSSSERMLRTALEAQRAEGAEVVTFSGARFSLPMYQPEQAPRTPVTEELIAAIRRAYGGIVCPPGYRGSVSGLIKNALDYPEDLRNAAQPSLEGRAVRLLACAAGWQATGTTLMAMRSIVHALRGWPTPLGVAVNSLSSLFAPNGTLIDAAINVQLKLMVRQVLGFCNVQARYRAAYQRETSQRASEDNKAELKTPKQACKHEFKAEA
jgi:FMN reductase